MKQQVLVIHGGTSFDTHEDYLAFLKTRELTLDRLLHSVDWKGSLGQALGGEFEVLVPRMPNGTNARYAEWCIWFERCLAFVEDGVILVGHSLGGIFLAKYLAEHDISQAVTAVVLVAAPFSDTSTVESLTDFVLPASLKKMEAQAGTVYLLHSHDDPVVSFEQVARYQQALPQAHVVAFADRGHFNQETFSELVALLTSLSSSSD